MAYVGRASRGQWNLGVCLVVVFSLLLGEREGPENAAEVRTRLARGSRPARTEHHDAGNGGV